MKTDNPPSALQEIAAASVTTSSQTPDILIYQIIDSLFAACNMTDHTDTESRSIEIQAANLLRSFIDIQHICRRVLDEYWETITAQQQQDFSRAFCDLLLQTCARKLIPFLKQQQICEEQIETYSINHSPKSSFAIIEIRLSQDDEQSLNIPVQFHYVLGEWKVCDVTLNGISLLNDYHAMFVPQLQNNSMSKLIRLLNRQRAALQNLTAA